MMVPRYAWSSKEAHACVGRGEPCVLLDCPLAVPNAERWTVDHLAEVIDKDFLCDVYCSSSGRFTYWDDTKNVNGYNFTPPTRKTRMTFGQYVEYRATASPDGESRYLQQGLVQEMGAGILGEYMRFPRETAQHFQDMGRWDGLTTNLLLCGPQGAVTPAHFDEQENVFAQLTGVKRVRLFPPAAWARLYPYPVGHPCDRQAQVRLPAVPGATRLDDDADQAAFPAFSAALDNTTAEMHVDLQPGECLYVPQYWWHQMEALTDNVSLSWWYKNQYQTRRKKQRDDDGTHGGSVSGSTEGKSGDTNADADADDDDDEEDGEEDEGMGGIEKAHVNLVAVRRNMERLVGDMVGGGQAAHRFFLAVAGGRLPVPPGGSKTQTLGIAFAPRYAHHAGDTDTGADGGTDAAAGGEEGDAARPLRTPLPRDAAATAEALAVPAHWPAVAAQAVHFVAMVVEVRTFPFTR